MTSASSTLKVKRTRDIPKAHEGCVVGRFNMKQVDSFLLHAEMKGIPMTTPIPITPTGLEKIKEELKRLKTVERPTIIAEIADARALGDLSENAEYHAARERQSFIEGRIMELEEKLTRLQVIQIDPGSLDKVVFGASVRLRDVSENAKPEEKTYKIVGDLEADLRNNAISLSSPLAASLINKRVGEIVTVNLPRGEKDYEIIKIFVEGPSTH
jgi:transcription elongation factor GreA